jgi:hypothetical protein
MDGECVEAQVRLRQLAARTLGGLVGRLEGDRLRAGDAGAGRAPPIRQPLATLLRHVLLSGPRAGALAAGGGAGATASPVVFEGQAEGEEGEEHEEEEEELMGGHAAGAGAAAAARALQLPLPSPSVYGATVALGCVGSRAFTSGLAPVSTRLGAHWADVAEDAAAPAHVRAWARHCSVALQRVTAGFFGGAAASGGGRWPSAGAVAGGPRAASSTAGVVARLVSAVGAGRGARAAVQGGHGGRPPGRSRGRRGVISVVLAARGAHRLAAAPSRTRAAESVECGSGGVLADGW